MATQEKPEPTDGDASDGHQDIESQLDALLDEIEEHEADAARVGHAERGAGAHAAKPSAAAEKEDADAVAGTFTDPSNLDDGGIVTADKIDAAQDDRLAGQLQDLLEEKKDRSKPAEADDEGAVAGAFEPVPTEQPAKPHIKSAASAKDGSEAHDDREDLSVESLDDMLAEGADDAVAGEFETVDDVAADADGGESAEKIASKASIRAARTKAGAATTDEEDDEAFDIEGAFESPDDLMSDDHDEAEEEEELEGAFETPESVNGLDGMETDESEGEPAGKEPAEVGIATSGEDSAIPRSRKRRVVVLAAGATRSLGRHAGRLIKVVANPKTIRATLVVVNKPLAGVSRSTRSLIGYIGVLTLINATFVLIWRLAEHFAGS